MSDRRLTADVERWAARTPDAPALWQKGSSLSYHELNERAVRLAGVLLEQDLAPGDRVGIYLEKSFDAVIAMLACGLAGGVYVPIDPMAPARRAAALAELCGMRHLVTDPERADAWQAGPGWPKRLSGLVLSEAPSHPVEADGARVAQLGDRARTDPTLPARDPRDPAYILYTSGSTGTPKGVAISHRNALAFVDWAADTFALNAADRLASHAPFHFDLSVFDLYAAFRVGASCVLLDEWTAHTPHACVERLHRDEISVWYSVPSALMWMGSAGGLHTNPPKALRLVLFAGEEFPVGRLRELVHAVPDASYWNLYGPTETNVCTAYPVDPLALDEYDALPIGRACCGDRIAVKDPDGVELGVGQVGELHVAGPTVMLGYWPLDPGSECREYATGDLAEWNERGDLVFHGRSDLMVKIRGHRIELREVEAILTAHPAVREAIAVAVETNAAEPQAGKQLMAHLVATDPSLSVLAIKRHCRDRLPPYMVPHRVRFHQDLPRTSSGKADRVRLAAV